MGSSIYYKEPIPVKPPKTPKKPVDPEEPIKPFIPKIDIGFGYWAQRKKTPSKFYDKRSPDTYNTPSPSASPRSKRVRNEDVEYTESIQSQSDQRSTKNTRSSFNPTAALGNIGDIFGGPGAVAHRLTNAYTYKPPSRTRMVCKKVGNTGKSR